jgi:hypothetical protein
MGESDALTRRILTARGKMASMEKRPNAHKQAGMDEMEEDMVKVLIEGCGLFSRKRLAVKNAKTGFLLLEVKFRGRLIALEN